METTGKYKWVTLWILLLTSVWTSAAPRECVYKNRALVIALLALHRGENCDVALQRGAQQVAALQLARDAVNSDADNFPELEVKVFDTCSSADQAVKAALKALVQAQQGCQGPFFLGLLGPDDADSLRAVAKVISVFNHPHVVLSTVRSFAQYNTLNVQVVDPTVNAKGLRMLLQELNWASFYLAFTPDAVSSQTATSLLEADELCVLQAVLQIPSANSNDFNAYNRLLHALQQEESARVVILSNTAESAEALLRHLDTVASKTKFVVYVLGSGLLPWKLPKDIAENTLILQETSTSTIVPDTFESNVENSPLWAELKNQSQCEGRCNDGPFVRDASTTNLAYAVHIFHEALRTGLANKCRPGAGVCSQLAGMTAEDWRTHLEGTSLLLKSGGDGKDSHKIRFHMLLPTQVSVFAVGDMGGYEEVGSIIEGEQLVLKKTSDLPILSIDRHEQCGVKTFQLATERPSTTTTLDRPSTTGMPLEVDIFGIDVKLGELGYYELVGILAGIVLAMVLIILIMICVVYKCFRVKVENTYSSPSSTSGDRTPKRPKQKKSKMDRKRFFNSSIRSVHTVRE